MKEDHDPRRGVGEGLAQRVRVERHRLPVHPDGHRLAERAALGLEGVAAQARDRGYQCASTRGRGERGRVPPRHGGLRRQAERPRAEAEARVDAARDRLVHGAHERGARSDRPEHPAGDRLVDRAQAAGGLPQLVEAERGQGPELGVAHERMPP